MTGAARSPGSVPAEREKDAQEPIRSALPRDIIENIEGKPSAWTCPGLRPTPVIRLGRSLAPRVSPSPFSKRRCPGLVRQTLLTDLEHQLAAASRLPEFSGVGGRGLIQALRTRDRSGEGQVRGQVKYRCHLRASVTQGHRCHTGTGQILQKQRPTRETTKGGKFPLQEVKRGIGSRFFRALHSPQQPLPQSIPFSG